jgi:hypothetical protein
VINEAFATLVDPDRRALYDRTLARERALPGYRTTAAREAEAKTQPPAADVRPFACAFCGAACGPGDRQRRDATCGTCDSPLHPAGRPIEIHAARRAITRIRRRLAITFFISWPQHPGFAGFTEDVSTNGMRFTSTVDLVPSERVKIDCAFCAAVAAVRHSRVAPGRPGTWDIGVEFLTLLIKPTRGVLVSTDA